MATESRHSVPAESAHPTPDNGLLLAEVSNAIVRLFKEQFGRGPTKVRSHFAGPDTLVCVLEDTLTAPEKTMQRLGELQRLRETRLYFQAAHESEFREAIEQITGRDIEHFMSGIDARTGAAAEIFVFRRGIR